MYHSRSFIALLVILGLLCGSSARAQCDTSWEVGPLTAPLAGADGPIYALLPWSPPAQPAQLIVAGAFTHIGGIAANNIAAWDGQFWHALDAGRSGPVYALANYNFSLIAAGEGPIGAWNGSTWVDRGSPSGTIMPGEIPRAYALEVFNNDLYIGGNFQQISPNPGFPGQGNLWRYNGSAWFNVPAGVGTAVHALEVFDADGAGAGAPALYIGGEGSATVCLRRWNGSIATDLSGPYADSANNAGKVFALTAISQNQVGSIPAGLMVGGDFQYVTETGGSSQCYDVAYFNGTAWFATSLGMSNHPGQYIMSMTVVGSLLYAGGNMELTPGQGYRSVMSFNGSVWTWLQLGEGAVHAVQAFNGQLVAGGEFVATASGFPMLRVARLNGSAWSSYSEPHFVRALARIGSRVVIGGYFGNATETASPPSTTNRYHISTWDYVNEGGLGWGTNGIVMALLGYSTGSGANLVNNIVAAGDFTACGPDPTGANIAANRVAIWSEPAASLAGWSAMGSGFNASVLALERFNGWVVAAGNFTSSGGTTTNRVAKYVGSPPSWQPLTSPDPQINGTVHALKAFSDPLGTNNYLIMGGDFTSATPTGVAANRILMRVENPVAGQSSYQALGAGFNGTVYAIERYGSGLNARTYAAGAFTASGTVNIYRVARLNGANWEPFGNGIGFNSTVFALKSIGGFLYAAGAFTTVDGIPANHLAKWNGTAWSDASGGADSYVYAIMGFQSELVAGGTFAAVQSATLPSLGVARLKVSGLPWIARQPISQSRTCGSLVNIDLILPQGYETATFQWRKGGVAISNGVTAHGSTISGATSAALSIANSKMQDAGSYDCVVTNPCGSATSTAATLTITGSCCPADTNHDGLVAVNDLLAVINGWGACGAPCPPTCAADVDGNCQINVTDLLAVINAWGPCP